MKHSNLTGAPANLTPQEKLATRNAIHLKEAQLLLGALREYVGHLEGAKPEGTPSNQSNWSAVEFLERLPFVFPGVDTVAELDQYYTELGIDDEGYRLNSDGERMHRWHEPVRRIGA